MTMRNAQHKGSAGIIVSRESSFATLYRLIDIVIVTMVYFFLIVSTNTFIDTGNFALLLVCIITYMLSAEAGDLYHSWRTSSTTMMLKRIAIIWMFTSLITITFAYILASHFPQDNMVVFGWLFLVLVALMLWRIILRKVLHIYRKKGGNMRTSIIIGATNSGYSLSNQLMMNEHLGISFNGFYDDREPERLPHEFQQGVYGNIENALELARENKVNNVYITLPMSAEKRIIQILNAFSDTTATVHLIPNFFIYNLLNARWQNIGSIQTLSVFDTPFQGATTVLKRLEDIVMASIILSVIAIPMLIIATAIKLTSPGPVIFKQYRYGLDGKKIKIYKFRSMTTQDNGPEIKQATKNDSRVTPLGAFLRRTSLDELPQFINVLQGRMSIVGPRPHAVAHNEEYRKLIEGYMLRHKVRPGITGWAQINGFRGETETINKMVKRVEYDLDYIHRWSVWLDIKIIFATIFKGFINRNAY